jgi:2-C-methyl-D-erythritol 4-phosphate cytidylyltransferase
MNVAIIAAAGQGSRIGSKRAKQFLELAGIPIIFHTLRAFQKCETISEIVVVLPPEDTSEFLSAANKFGVKKLTRVVAGGKTRAESVYRGLQTIRPATTELVVIHDGVRPFVTSEEIEKTIDAARAHGAAILVGPVTDTIKQINDADMVVQTMNRAKLRRALTPQCFHYELLRRAFEKVDVTDPELTDESVLVERLGKSVAVVEGSSRNIKITTSEDLVIAEAMLAAERSES